MPVDEWVPLWLVDKVFFEEDESMKDSHLALFGIFLLSQFIVGGTAFADKILERAETLSILEQITNSPRNAWISTGTIEAAREKYRAPRVTDPHEIKKQIKERIEAYNRGENRPEVTDELRKMRLDAIPFNIRYRLSNEEISKSTILIRCDGEKRYTEINVDSRTDSIQPSPNLKGNIKTRQFNMDWNARQIFAYDGWKYTTYLLPVNNAIIDSKAIIPNGVSSTLTAGLIPWGVGVYSYDNLTASNPTIVEKYIDGRTELHLTIELANGLRVIAVLDPKKDYALLSSTTINPDGSQTFHYNSDYQLIAGDWIPKTILREQYESASGRLLSRDLWNFKNVSAEQPSEGDFKVTFIDGALVQFSSEMGSRPLTYRYSESADIHSLLSEKLAFEASREVATQNCATVAMKLAIRRLEKSIPDQMLTAVVNESDGQTNLYDMRQLARAVGLYAYALKTDLTTLKSLAGCEIILHIPGVGHFVTLDRIDDKYVWLIDLSGNNFYYRVSVDFFDMDWPDGIALVLSTNPVWFQEQIAELSDLELVNIRGKSGYECTRIIQVCDEILCMPTCMGFYAAYAPLMGCEAAETGACVFDWFYGGVEAPCIVSHTPPDCTILDDEKIFYFMRACAYGDCDLWY